MKIKLHNSLAKERKPYGNFFLFDDKIFIGFRDKLYFRYKIDDNTPFLNFSPKTKTFEESTGFGKNRKELIKNRWRLSFFNWEEMDE